MCVCVFASFKYFEMSSNAIVPVWMPIFFVVICVITVYDSCYNHLFPRTANDGDLASWFSHHVAYAAVDTLFANPPASWWLKQITGPFAAVEIVLNLISVALYVKDSYNTPAVTLISMVYILSKTVMYIVYDLPFVDTSDPSQQVYPFPK